LAENLVINNFLRPFFRKGMAKSFSLPGTLSDQVKVLAIDSGDLSDLLFHVPLLQGIRQQFPGSRIDFLLPEEHTPLVVPSGLARQCLVYSPKQVRAWSPSLASLLRSVQKNNYEIAIVMSLTPNSVFELTALASGAALRCGPSHKRSYPSINFEIRTTMESNRYRGVRPIAAATFLGLPEAALQRRWPLPEDKLRQMQQLVHFNKPRKDELLIGVDPGFGKEGRGISLANLHFLVKQLSSQMSCRVLPLSDPQNQERLKQFESKLPGPPINLARDTLLETVLLLAQCDLFVASNTDLFHFAVAQEVPTLGLFSQQDGPEWDPGSCPTTRVLRFTKDQRVDIDTLMEAVEAVSKTEVTSQQSPV
jgi:ADP-heptose:LPS heptosyltransferase